MNEKMKMVLTKDDLARIKTLENASSISLNLHQLSVKEAQRLVKNIIALNRDNFTLTLIHGYHRGTKIKDMLNNEFQNERLVSKHEVKNNQGRTVFDIKAA